MGMRLPRAVKVRWRGADAWRHANKHRAHESCGAVGCNGCCRSEVYTPIDECEYIASHLPQELWDKLKTWELPGDFESCRTTPCPLLAEDGSCTIYKMRPTMCRVHMVASEPADCWVENGVKSVSIVVSPEFFNFIARHINPTEGSVNLLEYLKEQAHAH